MGENPKKYPERERKTKKFFDDGEEIKRPTKNSNKNSNKNRSNGNKTNQTNNLHTCAVCKSTYKLGSLLEEHQKTCHGKYEKESFFKYSPLARRNEEEDGEKVVVASQEMTEELQPVFQVNDEDFPHLPSSSEANLETPNAREKEEEAARPMQVYDEEKQSLNQKSVAGKKGKSQNKETRNQQLPSLNGAQHLKAPEEVVENVNQTIRPQSGNDRVGLVETAYEEIVKWRRNLFDLPKGNIGKRYVEEMTKLLNNWCSNNDNCELQRLMIMPSLLLQRTAKSCKGRVNKEHLQRRFELWTEEKYDELLEEGKCIQSRLSSFQTNARNNDDTLLIKTFRSHMLRGNVNAALRLLSSTGKSGILGINDDTIEQLHEKHPQGQPLNEEMMLEGPMRYIHPVIFDEIDEDLVQKVALRMKGAAGPSNFDSKDWKGVLVSKAYGTSSTDLCRAIVRTAKKLCTEEVDSEVAALMACRLIPLDKNPGLRPIGIGEVLRRIIGKLVVSILREDLRESAGDLQLCAGQESGCEAGIHAMHDIYTDEDTHGIIQVDANNAFNTINRKMFLHNINILCPEIATFIKNCYQQPARLFVVGGVEIQSREGTTQGAPSSMYVYGIGVLPLIMALAMEEVRQSAFADDLAGGGTLEQLRRWWDTMIATGKYIGYIANPSKSWLIVKPEYYDSAVQLFEGTGIKITKEGKRHLGAVVGTEQFKLEYIRELIGNWIEELKNLQKIGRVEPQLAYAAYIFGFQHKYTYFLRTIPNISNELKSLDQAIDEYVLKPILENYDFNETERQWFSLPARKGGLGILIPSEVSDVYYVNSRYMTTGLVQKIVHQKQTEVANYEEMPHPQKHVIRAEKEQREAAKSCHIKSTLNPEKAKIFEAITEKGASNWLTTLPNTEHGFYLNKQIFWDSVKIRYGIPLSRLPNKCACGANFSVDHAFTCKTGGFVSIRHNEIRDFTAELLRETCQDVEVEPILTPLTGEHFRYKSANTEIHARLDVSARGVWIRGSKAFFDVRVFNPLARSYREKTIIAAHKMNENEKKREYQERIQHVEHGSFTPLVFTCFGGMSFECNKFYSHVSDKISEKRDIPVSMARSWVRTKLSFSLLKTANLCIRGSKSLKPRAIELSSTAIRVAVADTRLNTDGVE